MAPATLIPPQAPPSWTHTAEEVKRLAKEEVEKDRKVKDQVAALQESECNFETVRSLFASQYSLADWSVFGYRSL